ncbi:MAG: sulfatase-like hydrolase/transferase [Akkermansiaceae bacterium]|nr:sulfatase-like hydrolase/transferase [Akkermansiaceae bacterium]MDP4647042.1 sulfatase-like hydrolase/transferase [Akkermansiaceae bacterium]MDP4721798.1 sulfatase-like hydrolase/transferase [Akkermansiaceae bacterium]MDP4847385.1 sulfatase-like hydrolase/transferase [Akkermansiaceae bacterium]MDP4897700.1 sulfatase-like hydrolase/transferase [Akkermansiaceae bacterium]
MSFTAIFRYLSLSAVLPLMLSTLVAAEKDRPNIIFIFADDWGYGDVGIHGSTFCDTPNLDKMAKEGIDFANFTVNSPVCSPSRVAVMTGQFPARHSIHQHFQGVKAHIKRGMPDWLDTEAPLLPRYLKEAGYKTGHFGKWHLGSSGDSPTEDKYGYDSFATFNGSKVNEIKKSGLAGVDHAENFIHENKDQPFFVNLWLHEVHTAHYPQERYMEKFKELTDKQQVYASVIAEGDEAVGRIIKLLGELELDDNTLVVFSTDNGPEKEDDQKVHDDEDPDGLGKYYSVGETGGLKGEKRSLFSGGIRVPFIVRWPNVAPAGMVDKTSVITAVDLLPTFLEAAGVELPEDYQPDGESILSAWKGKGFERTKPIFWEWRGGDNGDQTWPNLAIHDGKWKLLINEEQGKTELYDLENDWAEKKDLASDFPEVVEELNGKIDAWKASLPTEPSKNALSKARLKK